MKAVIGLLLLPFMLTAQRNFPVFQKRDILLRYNPSGLLDFTDVNITFGAERRIANNLSVGIDAGFIPYSHRYPNSRHSLGFVLRPAAKWYPRSRTFYLETEFEYRWVSHRIEDWIGRDVVNRVPSYEEFASFRYRRVITAINIKSGRIRQLSRNSLRWWWEVYGGLGFRCHSFRLVNQPRSRYESFNMWGIRQRDERYYTITVPLGVKLAYLLYRR